jgi:hypothetical protein
MRGLALVEAALLSPDDATLAVTDALRRVALLACPRVARAPWGNLLGPSEALQEAVLAWLDGRTALSCASARPDASLLVAGAMLGAAGTPLPRAALLLRATSRDPVTLCAALAASETVRRIGHESLPLAGALDAARLASQAAADVLRELPGSLSGPPEAGVGAMTLSLARAGSADSVASALADLNRDASDAPEVVLGAVLGALACEPNVSPRHAVVVLRHGGAASDALAVMLAAGAAVDGLKALPLSWLSGLREHARLAAFADAALGAPRRAPRLAFPAADLCWTWAHGELDFRSHRDEARRSMPPPARAEQLGLFPPQT